MLPLPEIPDKDPVSKGHKKLQAIVTAVLLAVLFGYGVYAQTHDVLATAGTVVVAAIIGAIAGYLSPGGVSPD